MNQVILAVFWFLFLDILSYNLVNTTTNLIRSVSVASVGADRSLHSGAFRFVSCVTFFDYEIATKPAEVISRAQLLAQVCCSSSGQGDFNAFWGLF